MTEYLDNYAEENFSGFEGDQDMGMMSAYTGEGDDFLDFDGPGNSFANQKDLQRTFSLHIKNNGSDTRRFVLFNGFKRDAVDTGEIFLLNSGYMGKGLSHRNPEVALINGETVMTTGYSVSGSPSSLDDLREYIKTSPVVLGFVRIKTNNVLQLENPISLSELTPFRQAEVRNLFLQEFTGENTFRDNIVTVPTPGVILGNETKISMDILPDTAISITFFFGAVFSNSAALKGKQKKAVSSIAAVGLPRVLQSQAIRRGLTR